MGDEHRDSRLAFLAPRSRRAAFRAAGGGLAATAALLVRPASAQTESLPEAVAEFLAGWEALDADRVAATFAADGVREDITVGEIARGRADVRRSVAGFFAAFDGAAVEHPVAFAAGDQAVDSWVFTGRYTGALPGLPPGEGQAVTIQGLTLIELAGGAIRRTTDYYDQYGILAQLGALPPLEPVGSPEATPAD